MEFHTNKTLILGGLNILKYSLCVIKMIDKRKYKSNLLFTRDICDLNSK